MTKHQQMAEIGYVLWCNRGGRITYSGDIPQFLIVVTKIAPKSTENHPEIPDGYYLSNLIDVFICHDSYRLENVVLIYMQTYGAENVVGGKYTYPARADSALQELRRLITASITDPCFRCGRSHHVLNCTVSDRREPTMRQNLPNYNAVEDRIKNDIVKLNDGPFDQKTVASLHSLTQIILMTGSSMQQAMRNMTICGDHSAKILADPAKIVADATMINQSSRAPLSTNLVKIAETAVATTAKTEIALAPVATTVTIGENTITAGDPGDDILSAGDIEDDPLDQISEAASAAAPVSEISAAIPLIAVANKPAVIRSAVWTAEEEKMLEILMEQNRNEAEIAEVMNREEFGVARKISTNIMRDKINGMSAQDIRAKYHLSDDQVTKYLPRSAINRD